MVLHWQISKKKKKESKKARTDDNDSGVEVYFREEEDKEDEGKPAKVSNCLLNLYSLVNLHRLGDLNTLNQNLMNTFSPSAGYIQCIVSI